MLDKISPKNFARLIGVVYMLMVPFGVFGIMYVISLLVHGDAAATAKNIMAAGPLFRPTLVSALVVQLLNIAVVLMMYRLFKPVNKMAAALIVIFIMLAVPIAMLNQINQYAADQLLSGAKYLNVFSNGQKQALALMFLNMQQYGILIAGIFWGLWLLPMGYCTYKSGFIPKFVGVLVLFGGIGYVIDSFGLLLSPGFAGTLLGVIVSVMMYGEMIMPFWLLIMGVDSEKWKKRAAESV